MNEDITFFCRKRNDYVTGLECFDCHNMMTEFLGKLGKIILSRKECYEKYSKNAVDYERIMEPVEDLLPEINNKEEE